MFNYYNDELSYKKINSSIVSIKEYKNIVNSRKIAVFSAFVKKRSEFNYHDKIYNWLKINGYSVILVMPITIKLDIADEKYSNSCDVLIQRENFGYDFGSYASGLQFLKQFDSLDNLLFINDSIIGPFGSTNKIHDDVDFWCNTDSYQIKYHYQSYLFGFRVTKLSLPAIFEFFFGRGDIYTNDKDKVIVNFELRMHDFFFNKGLNCKVIYPSKKLKQTYITMLSGCLKKPYTTSKLKYYIIVALSDINPTHHLWLELFNSGFPFLKKELLRENPTCYPYLHEIIEYKMIQLGCISEYKKILSEYDWKTNV